MMMPVFDPSHLSRQPVRHFCREMISDFFARFAGQFPFAAVAILLAFHPSLTARNFAQNLDPTQFPAYIQLRRDVIINSDLWTESPEILSAGYGFEGIQGIPGLLTVQDLPTAIDAGAGVNLDWAQLDPVPPIRNLTSGGSVLGIMIAGFGAQVLYADAMPIVFSWPILPSTVSPTDIAIHLNTGEVVTPLAAALNPNYDHNERHVIVVFGYFGNRLQPDDPEAVYPVSIEIVADETPLMAVGPKGPVSLVGLTAASSHPYVAGPALVGAKLSRFSPVGDFPVPALNNAFPNDARSLFGNDSFYRLRLFTSGGFSPDGVSGLMPDDFPRFFRLHAAGPGGKPVVISETGKPYQLGNGVVEVVGLAEVGAPQTEPLDRAYYVEDHDNYFDIVLKGDERAIRRLTAVEIPTSLVPGYFDIYNPGGPGRTPQPETLYTRPALPQMQPIWQSLDDPRTVSYAAQSLDQYDDDDDLAVVFRLRDEDGPDRLTSSSIVARAWLQEGLSFVRTDFANEMARPGVADVEEFVHSTSGDRIYTADPQEQQQLKNSGNGWIYEGRAFGAFRSPEPGARPVYRFYNSRTRQTLYSFSRAGDPSRAGFRFIGVAWYAAEF
jgi:hypothetical protein